MDSSALTRRLRAVPAALLILGWLLLAAPGSGAAGERFGGVGLQVVPTAGGELVVLRVVEGSPADEEGLRPGDLIFRVDDRPLAGSDFAEVVSELLWGPVGSPVTLHYLRPGVAGQASVTLRRIPLSAAPEPTPGVRMITPKEPKKSHAE